MKAAQFWILMVCSTLIAIMLLQQIHLTRKLYQQERTMGDSQEEAARGPVYEKAWQNIAIRIYEVGANDPALQDVLKKENIAIHPNASSAPSAPGAPTAPEQVPIVNPPVPAPTPHTFGD
jgi:hypothetical protein